MHLLHRSSIFSGDGGRALRRVGSFPRASVPSPAATRHTLSRSESIKKKSGAGAAKRSKRARLRAGLAAALQELRLAAGRKHGAIGSGAGASAVVVVSAGAARPGVSHDDVQRGGCCAAGAAPAPLHVSGGGAVAQQASRGIGLGVVASGGRRVKNAAAGWPLLLVVAVLALACVVALGRAPAVCCCTCAAWLCRGPLPLCGAPSTGRRAPPEQRALCCSVVQ